MIVQFFVVGDTVVCLSPIAPVFFTVVAVMCLYFFVTASYAIYYSYVAVQRYKSLERLIWQMKVTTPFYSFSPQSGIADAMNDVKTAFQFATGFELDGKLLNNIENLAALATALKDCETTSQFLSIMFLYLKTHYSKSIATTVAHFLAEETETSFSSQAGEFTASDNEKPDWLKLLRECQNNWSLVIRHEGFAKLSRMISMCLALGLCDAANLNFSIHGMKLFSIEAYTKQITAIDMVDALFDTITCFVEGGYMCFKMRSIKPFLYGNMSIQEFESNFIKCTRANQLAQAGNLEMEGLTEDEFDKLLYDTISKCTELIHMSRGTVEKTILTRKREILIQWQTTFYETRVQGGLRVAPYTVGVFGGTGVGKSSVANTIIPCLLKMNGYDASDDRIVTLNMSDKYMSNFRSHVLGVILDDFGNAKAEYSDLNPTTWLITLCNNIRAYANMAEAHLKGKVSIEPKVVVITKNEKTNRAHIYSVEPASIARRDSITLTVRVKPEYEKFGMLDQRKIPIHTDIDSGSWSCPDLWEIDVERCVPIPPEEGNTTAGIRYLPILDNASLPEVLQYLQGDSAKHFENQKRVVQDGSDVGNRISLCKNCNLPLPNVCICGRLNEMCESEQSDSDETYGETEYRANQEQHESDDDSSSGLYLPPAFRPMSDDEDSDMGNSETIVEEKPKSRAVDFPPKSLTWKVADKKGNQIQRVVFSSQAGFLNTRYDRLRTYLYFAHRRWAPGEYFYHYCSEFWKRKTMKYIPKLLGFSTGMEYCSLNEVWEQLEWLENSPWAMWTNWIPQDWLESKWGKKLVFWGHYQHEKSSRIKKWIYCSLGILSAPISLYSIPFATAIAAPAAIGYAHSARFEKERLYRRVVQDNEAMPKVFTEFRNKHVKWITCTIGVLAVLYLLAKMKTTLGAVIPQGNLHPTTPVDIAQRDSEVNPWAGVVVSPMPCSKQSKTTTPDILTQMAEANTCHMSIEFSALFGKKKFVCDAFFPKSNVAIIPKHTWSKIGKDEFRAKFVRHSPLKIGGNFTCPISRDNSYDIPDTDFSVVYVPSGGDWKDLTPYLPQRRFHSRVPARLVHRKMDGSTIYSPLQYSPQTVSTTVETFFGGVYDLQFSTFEGLCMSPIVTETKGPLLGGFHLGGKNGMSRGCAGMITHGELSKALREISKKPGVILSKSSGTFPEDLYGVQVCTGTDVHKKSPVNYMPEDTNFKYFGNTTGRSKYHTEVTPTPISSLVEEVCGVPQKWAGPKFNVGYPWQASLSHSAKPSVGIEGNLLNRAVEDYQTPLLNLLKKFKWMRKEISPLSKLDTVCGIDGKRFIDKMPAGTSIGFPLSGMKRNHLVELDPKDYPSHQYPVALDEEFWEHAEKMREEYRHGRRAYPIFKACLKDEPTPLDKDKVRVFQAAPCALQLLVRQYFLPVARFISLYPMASECAVGINAQGPEWDVIAEHMKQFGSDRILAGDYSKYDLRMPAQVMFAAFKVMIEIARHCGYSADDITIMEGIATDICYPIMAYNGDLLQLFGSNPSGQNLTVYINSLVNSLLLRSAYFHIFGMNAPPFQENCAIMTYGDDCKGSVHKKYSKFNHISFAKFLEERDMVFTMPDKESTPTQYMEDRECDFLKRKNRFDPDLNMIVGMLDEDSIFKSLHSVVRSGAVTLHQQSMANIDGALREWFSYGRDHYEMRREQMREIASKAGIAHGCTMLNQTYDDRLAAWKERYAQE